jgi:hypothetical protein
MNACRSATFVSEGVNHAAPQPNLDGPQIGATEIFQPFANDFALTAGSFVQMCEWRVHSPQKWRLKIPQFL